ncbi:hypothetical protein ACJ41O_015025 [Fusarium nematophilum]
MKFSLPWLAFWNLGLLALSICVLAGCRSNMEKNYSIVNWPRSTIALVWGDECANATADIIPDKYKLGASGERLILGEIATQLTLPGTCRVFDGKTSCKSRFPPSLNLAKAVLHDLSQANSSDAPAILQECAEAIDKPIDHSTAEKLGVAMISFIIVSIFINLISLVVAGVTGEPFGVATTSVLVIDALFLFTSLILCIAMMNYEGGGYLKGVHGGDFSDREMIGVAIWMLVAMVIARVLSNPWLLIVLLAILLPIALVFLLFLVRTRGFFAVVRAYASEQ